MSCSISWLTSSFVKAHAVMSTVIYLYSERLDALSMRFLHNCNGNREALTLAIARTDPHLLSQDCWPATGRLDCSIWSISMSSPGPQSAWTLR